MPRGAQKPPHWQWPKAILRPTGAASTGDTALIWAPLGKGRAGSVSLSGTQNEESAIFRRECSSLLI